MAVMIVSDSQGNLFRVKGLKSLSTERAREISLHISTLMAHASLANVKNLKFGKNALIDNNGKKVYKPSKETVNAFCTVREETNHKLSPKALFHSGEKKIADETHWSSTIKNKQTELDEKFPSELCNEEFNKQCPQGKDISKKRALTARQAIALSSQPFPDFSYKVNFDKRDYKIKQVFERNSTLNGSKKNDGSKIERAISAGGAFTENTSMMRRVSDKDGTICYTGRCETDKKAEETVKSIFKKQYELDQKRGIKTREDGTSELTLIDSTLVNSIFLHRQERQFFRSEKWAFEKLKNRILSVEVNDGGTRKTVQFVVNPIIMPQGFDMIYKLLGWAFVKSKRVAKRALESLEKIAEEKLVPENCQKLVAIIDLLKNSRLIPEEISLAMEIISETLGLPSLLHCKASTDRTALATTVLIASRQWAEQNSTTLLDSTMEKENGKWTFNPQKVLGASDFKEFFAANLLSSFQIPKYHRMVDPKTDKTILDIFKWRKGWLQQRTLHRLLPGRYLTQHKPKTWWAKILFYLTLNSQKPEYKVNKEYPAIKFNLYAD